MFDQLRKSKLIKPVRFLLVIVLVFTWVFSAWPPVWQNPPFPPEIQEARALDTGFNTTVSTAAVTSSAGDNNGFETTYGTNTPKDTTTDNAAGLASANTSSGAATDGCTTFPQAEDDQHDFYAFGFSIPANSKINGIEIGTQLTVSSNSGTNLFCFALSYDGGAHWTAAQSSGDIGTTESAKTLGGAVDTWGRTWSVSELSDANFRIRVMLDPSATLTYTFSMDLLQVKVYYTGLPTVTTQAAGSVEATTATGNGTIEATGGENASAWGVCYKTSSGCTTADSTAAGSGTGGAGTFTASMTSLSSGTTYYIKAYATNSAGTSYGDEVTILTKPAAPTSVAATDGTYTDKVTITWTKSTGATNYHVWRDSTDLGAAGDVATYDDTGADAPTITAGSTVASDGTSTAQVDLSLSGTSANNGTTHTYKVVASNATGNSADSATDTGYRGVGSLTYQWQKSAADSDASYSNIDGATSSTYNDTAAPAPTVTAGTASATDGSATDKTTLSISGASANNGEGRYYKCVLNATGAAQQTSASNRGYRGVGALTYQWYRSSGTGDSGYSILSGATTAPYDDTTAPAPTITAGTASASDGTSASYVALSVSGQSANVGAVRYYYCTISATGANSADTNHNDGYIGVGSLTYQWQRSAADSNANYSDISGATTASYNDTGAPADGSGRYYKVALDAMGASQQISTADRGYRKIVAISITTDGSINFNYLPTNTTKDTTVSGINDPETISVDSGPVDLDVKTTVFSQGGNTWTLGTGNGSNIVKWEFSKDGSSWTTFANPGPSTYAFDTNVAQGQTRNIYLKITTPTETSSYQQYSATVTIIASAPD